MALTDTPSSRPQAGKIQAFSEMYDIGGTGYGAIKNTEQYVTVSAFSIGGGTFTATFAPGQGAESLAWVEDNLGNVLDLTVRPPPSAGASTPRFLAPSL